MNDKANPEPFAGNEWLVAGPKNAQLVYILYFLSFLFGGIPSIVGVVIAYMNRGKAGGFTETHYTWLIRTFWIGLLYSLVAAFLMVIGVGFLLVFAVLIWVIIRLVKGIMALGRNEAIPAPESWLI